ncbi:MAG: glycosyltransferase family 4 protein [Mucilaginibacter sp.]
MKFVFASYVVTPGFNDPDLWLKRIGMSTGILEKLAKHHTVISVEQINYRGKYVKNKVDHRFMVFPALQKYFPVKLHRFIKSERPDVVMIQGLHFPWQVILLRWALGKNTKIILQHHAEQPYRKIRKYLQQWADRNVDAYLFASTEIGMDWVKKGNLATPQKIHQVMEVSSMFSTKGKTATRYKRGKSADPFFLWVGRLNANKDPLTVVSAFLKFTLTQPTARLNMIYHTDELLSDIEELLSRHENGHAVTLVGRVLHEDLQYWYEAGDFILSGSHYEGSGTAVCEAMSCGCVPIVTDIASFRMITDNGQCGFLYQPGNEQQLLDLLLQTSQIDLASKRASCLAYFKSNLSFEAISKQIVAIAARL